jgi:hypothetical protein
MAAATTARAARTAAKIMKILPVLMAYHLGSATEYPMAKGFQPNADPPRTHPA